MESAEIDVSTDEDSDDSVVIPVPSASSINELLTVDVPTRKENFVKRRRIRANFYEANLSTNAQQAQQIEKNRLERLAKLRNVNAAVPPTPSVLSKSYPASFGASTQFIKPSLSTVREDVIEISSDDDDSQSIEYVASSSPRKRHVAFERQELCEDRTEVLHRVERERLKKAQRLGDLESKELYEGRLLVNTTRAPDEPAVYIPAHLTNVLQPHQLGGVRFMFDNVVESVNGFARSPGLGCILAHAMGLGKTLQVITFCDVFVRATGCRKVLIIVPVNTIQNWAQEFDRWLPDTLSEGGEYVRPFNIWFLNDSVKTSKQRIELIQSWHSEGGVLLIGYDIFRLIVRLTPGKKSTAKGKKPNRVDKSDENDSIILSAMREALLDPGPDLVICDEGHRIKNEKTGIASTLNSIRTRRRIVLTGYPLQNNLMEYFCMVDFVRPFYLGTKREFSFMFEKPIKNGLCVDSTRADIKLARQRTHILIELLKGFVQRRTHHLLRNILPPSREYVVLLRKSEMQRMLYRDFIRYAQSEMCFAGTSVFNPLKAFAVCTKIWNHPDIMYEAYQKRIAETERGKLKQEEPSFAVENLKKEEPVEQLNYLQGYTPSDIFKTNKSEQNIEATVDEVAHSYKGADLKSKTDRGRPTTILRALMEELDLDYDIQYDWASFVFRDYQKDVVENGYKMVVSISIIEKAVEAGEKVLLFSQSLLTLNLIERFLANSASTNNGMFCWKKNFTYLRFDGSTSATEREKLIARFCEDPNVTLFLISTKAGSLGINLVSASRVIIFDASWNPCHDAQAVCRVYRYGQKRCTFVYRLIMDNSMEKAIFNRQIGKSSLQQRVVDDRQIDIDVTKKELERLLVYDEALDVVCGESNAEGWQIEDSVLWLTAVTHPRMFSQKPVLHESLLTEREDVLSEEEKAEAKMLYENEKHMLRNGYFDYYDGVPRNSRIQNGFIRPSPSPRMLPVPQPDQSFNPPLRATPIAMVLERVTDDWHNSGGASTDAPRARNTPSSAIQIVTDREMELPCLTAPGTTGKVFANERCWLVTLPTGVFIRSLNGDIYDARGTAYDITQYASKTIVKPFKPDEVIDLCDSD